RRHTRSKRDWSSDVCSSDLHYGRPDAPPHLRSTLCRSASASTDSGGCTQTASRKPRGLKGMRRAVQFRRERAKVKVARRESANRSEERRVGKEGRWR